MVPKQPNRLYINGSGFRAVLFRMVPKQDTAQELTEARFRAVLFRMVPKLTVKLRKSRY